MNTTFLQYRKTYNAGLLQAKAFRILKKHTNNALQPMDISATEWGILGILLNNSQGLRLSKIAGLMGVKAPFVTQSMAILMEKNFVNIDNDKSDTRVKIAKLTAAGKDFIKKAEPLVAKEIKKTFSEVSIRNLLGYLSTLHAVVKTYSEEIDSTDLSHLED